MTYFTKDKIIGLIIFLVMMALLSLKKEDTLLIAFIGIGLSYLFQRISYLEKQVQELSEYKKKKD